MNLVTPSEILSSQPLEACLNLRINMEPQVQYLLSLRSIRERAKIVEDVANSGKLTHFDLHGDKLDDVADFVTSIIKVRG